MKNLASKKLPLVSIIMNCHNGEKYLKDSIKSIISQTYKNWELVFWDNNSKDNSKKIVKNFNDKRIKYFKSKKFNSLYHSRNLAIKKAKGKYIGFLDVDDLWEKRKLQRQMIFFFKNRKIKVIYSNFFFLHQSNKKKRIGYNHLLPTGFITQNILNNYTVGFVTTMLHKSVFNEYKFNSKYNIIGDFDFFLRISKKYEFGCIQLPLAYYRVHGSNLSIKRIDIHIKELKEWLDTNKNKFKKLSFNTNPIVKSLIILKIKYYLKFLGV